MIHNRVERIEQLSDGVVYATLVFFTDTDDYKELWQTAIQPPTPEQLTQLVTDHTQSIQAKIVDPVALKVLFQFQGQEIQVSK